MVKRKAGSATDRLERGPVDAVAGLAGSLAHDFSNLLMIIRSAGEALKEALPEESPAQTSIDDLFYAADRVTRLTQQLQAIGQSQLMHTEPIVPAQLVRGMADVLRRIIPEDVDFQLSLRSESVILFAAAQLQVALLNIVAWAAERVSSHGTISLVVSEDDPPANVAPGQQRYVSIVVAKT